MSEQIPRCGRCPFDSKVRVCQQAEGKSPDFCPTVNREEVIRQAVEKLRHPAVFEFARQASVQEGEGYADRELGYDKVRPCKPRIVEIIEFARRMKYKRLGFVFCIGLRQEAKVVEKLLADCGFEVVSAVCKVGRVPKEEVGVRDDQKIRIGSFEAMCNPIAQALLMNHERTEFNIVMGLCVGHDSLFLKYAEAPCTVLAAKDRLLGHNPLAAIYNIDSYYRFLRRLATDGKD